MDILTINDLNALISKEEGTFISIYMPTFRGGVDTRQNHIKFKQLLRSAEATLYDMEWRKEEIESFLKPASQLIPETHFWQNQSDGLALYIHNDGITYFRLPYEFIESVTVSNKIFIKPLLPLFSGNGQFNILALSKNDVRFFRATRHNAIEIDLDLEGGPGSMFDMQVDDDYENPDTRTALRLGRNDLVYNKATQSQNNENDYERNELTRYFRALDATIMNLHEGEDIPLVLAGVEYLIPIYREKSNYPNIVKDFIRGNPEQLSGDDLHKLAWEIVEPILLEDKKMAEDKYNQYLGQKNNLTLNSLDKIIPAAFNGQIESIFIDIDTEEWGQFDHEKNKIEIKEEGSSGAEDLIEYVSLLTLSRGGKVYTLDREELANEEKLAAVLRY